jgi:hypothetical protein
MALADDLREAVLNDYTSWKNQTIFYNVASDVFRVSLIILTSLVAARTTLTWLDHAHPLLFPLLAVITAVLTALDAWLKPREKWKGFMNDRYAAQLLLMLVKNTDPKDAAKIAAYVEELRKLEERHVEKNVY